MSINLQLLDFIQQSGKSQKQIAKEIGLSTSVISQFLNSTYTGDNDEIATKIKQYLSMGKSRLNRIQIPAYCPNLHNAEQVTFAAMYAHQNNDISLVYGDAGAGKTTALKHYAENNPGVIYLAANASSKTSRSILFMITEAVGKQPTGTEFMLMRNLVALLKNTNRLLIIDEADHLSVRALQSVRNLNDEANLGLVLAGNDVIKHQMYGRGSLQFDQLRTRVGPKKKVFNSYTIEEIKMLFPHLGKDSIQYLLKIACTESLRTAVKRYVFAAQCANAQDKSLNAKILRESELIQTEGY